MAVGHLAEGAGMKDFFSLLLVVGIGVLVIYPQYEEMVARYLERWGRK